MKQAKDLMTVSPYTIQSGAELPDVVKWFVENSVTSAPVVTPTNEIIGVFSELTLLRAFLRHHLKPSRKDKVIHYKELLAEPSFVKETDPLAEVIKTMLKSPTHRVLVTNSSGALVGIISPKDVMGFLAGETKRTVDLSGELEKTRQKITDLQSELLDTKSILKKYEKLYFDNPTMMHSVDGDGFVIMANRKIHEVLEYDQGELIGKTLFEIYDKTYHDEAARGLKAIVEQGFHHAIYSTMISKTGKKVRVDLASSALYDSKGRFTGTITVSREVDSEALLRALHGALNDHEINEQALAELVSRLDK